MAVAILLAAPENGISGCSGPCYSCHPKLQGDKNHASLGTCALCHTGQTNQFALVPKSNVNGGCGDRCFQCHSDWPKDGYHAELYTCLKCHNS